MWQACVGRLVIVENFDVSEIAVAIHPQQRPYGVSVGVGSICLTDNARVSREVGRRQGAIRDQVERWTAALAGSAVGADGLGLPSERVPPRKLRFEQKVEEPTLLTGQLTHRHELFSSGSLSSPEAWPRLSTRTSVKTPRAISSGRWSVQLATLTHSTLAATTVLAGVAILIAIAECGQFIVLGPLVAEIAPPHLLGRYMSLYQLSFMVGVALGPAVGGVLLGTSPDTIWWGGAFALALTGAGFLRLGNRIPDPLLPTKSPPLQAASEAT
jgi:MFS family permease